MRGLLSVFRFVDKVSEVKKNESVTAFFTLKGDEEFLKDHFEGFPVMPGVLQIEALAQAASALLASSGGPAGKMYRLVRVANVKFGQFVRPGNLLKLSARLVTQDRSGARFEGRIELMDGGLAAARVVSTEFVLAPVA
jgi:3-hydroxyacyl-[acyl-carrier-protein] dehydratase